MMRQRQHQIKQHWSTHEITPMIENQFLTCCSAAVLSLCHERIHESVWLSEWNPDNAPQSNPPILRFSMHQDHWSNTHPKNRSTTQPPPTLICPLEMLRLAHEQHTSLWGIPCLFRMTHVIDLISLQLTQQNLSLCWRTHLNRLRRHMSTGNVFVDPIHGAQTLLESHYGLYHYSHLFYAISLPKATPFPFFQWDWPSCQPWIGC